MSKTNKISGRSIRIATSGATSILARGSSLATFGVAAPIVLHETSLEIFGLWIFITTLAQLSAFSDLGLGNGLVNRLAELRDDADRGLAKKLVSTCFCMVAVSHVFILAIALVWISVMGGCTNEAITQCAAAPDFSASVVLYLCCLALGAVAGISQKVHIAEQRHYRNNILLIASNMVSLLIFLIPAAPKNTLWMCVAISAAPVAIISLVDAVSFFMVERRDLCPSPGLVDVNIFITLFRDGWRFFLLQVMALVSFAGDSFIVGAFLGASQLAVFGAAAKLTNGLSIIQHFSTSSWAAFSEAIARGETAWARKAFGRLLIVAFVLAVSGAAFMMAAGPFVLRHWLGAELVPSTALLAGFSAWLIVSSICSVISSVMNSATFLHRQLFIYTVTFVVALVGKAIAIYYNTTSGIIWASVLSFGIVFAFPTLRIIWDGLAVPSAKLPKQGSTSPWRRFMRRAYEADS